MSDNIPIATTTDPGIPLAELRDRGLLWLINTTVFHPRGLGLALHFNDESEVTGWSLIAAGPGEPFTFPDDADTHERFRQAEHTMQLVTEGLL